MYQDIFTHELEFWRKDGATIIDVRETDEYQNGHIPGAINLPLSELEARASELTGKLVVVCQSGGRSRSACDYLQILGHTDLANLQGGTGAWAREGRTLETEKPLSTT